MKLLICTQAVDSTDPVLGFFVRWIEEFAKHVEQIEVICLKEGKHTLPSNVRVHSLGKEKGFSRGRYLLNFYRYIWRFRNNYDTVFVHMNQEYILLGASIWKPSNKKILLWRNHAKGNLLTSVSVWISNTVFYTSPHSFVAKYKKAHLMPVGIDTNLFKPDSHVQKLSHSILFLGRIAPVKNADVFIDALNELQKKGVEFVATIAGEALERDKEYDGMVRDSVVRYGLNDKVSFIGAVTQVQALQLYQEHELYVNLTPSGSMDKTIFEAMACGTVVLTSNQALRAFLQNDALTTEINASVVAEKLSRLMRWPEEMRLQEGVSSREKVKATHDLSTLIDQIVLA